MRNEKRERRNEKCYELTEKDFFVSFYKNELLLV